MLLDDYVFVMQQQHKVLPITVESARSDGQQTILQLKITSEQQMPIGKHQSETITISTKTLHAFTQRCAYCQVCPIWPEHLMKQTADDQNFFRLTQFFFGIIVTLISNNTEIKNGPLKVLFTENEAACYYRLDLENAQHQRQQAISISRVEASRGISIGLKQMNKFGSQVMSLIRKTEEPVPDAPVYVPDEADQYLANVKLHQEALDAYDNFMQHRAKGLEEQLKASESFKTAVGTALSKINEVSVHMKMLGVLPVYEASISTAVRQEIAQLTTVCLPIIHMAAEMYGQLYYVVLTHRATKMDHENAAKNLAEAKAKLEQADKYDMKKVVKATDQVTICQNELEALTKKVAMTKQSYQIGGQIANQFTETYLKQSFKQVVQCVDQEANELMGAGKKAISAFDNHEDIIVGNEQEGFVMKFK